MVPVLERPHRVEPLLDSIAAATPGPCSVLFICDPDDEEEKQAVYKAGGSLIEVDGGYPEKINAAVRSTDAPFLFLAADDLEPKPEWLKAAKKKICETVQVVGVNDLIDRPHRPQHATHFLMTRAYAELPTIDGGRGPMYEGYAAWYSDDELIATAKHRDAYAYAPESIVEHLHPFASKSPDDSTYKKGRARARIDSKLFHRRQALWT